MSKAKPKNWKDAAQVVAVKHFRAQHPKRLEQGIGDYFERRQKIYKTLVQRTNDKYKKIAAERGLVSEK
jgi:hypothetical protein